MAKNIVSNNRAEETKFIGRVEELQRLSELDKIKGGKILVVYGRRRVGKTTLIKKAFSHRRLVTFEDLEVQAQAEQLQHFAEQLAENFHDPKLARIRLSSWRDAFELLWEFIAKGKWTVHLEEIQWMADYKPELISDLKYVWDNFWQNNPELIVVLCGSAPSFLIENVMHSKALYNRSQWEFPVGELPINQVIQLIGAKKEPSELLDGYLVVGGIPEYARLLSTKSSVYLSLVQHAFTKGGFFVHEAKRIFTSSLTNKPQYRAVIESLAKHGLQTKAQLLNKIKYSSGGGAAEIFRDLEQCEFIYPYSPLGFGDKTRENKWIIRDSYLQLYYRLIEPGISAIQRGEFSKNPTSALNHTEYRKWLGLSFERFCLFQHRAIAQTLGFSGVEYKVGPYYLRGGKNSAQIDLAYLRKDKVLTICEIKYLTEPPGKEIIPAFEKSLLMLEGVKAKTVQKVLISPNGIEEKLEGEGYFDEVIDLKRLNRVIGS